MCAVAWGAEGEGSSMHATHREVFRNEGANFRRGVALSSLAMDREGLSNDLSHRHAQPAATAVK